MIAITLFDPSNTVSTKNVVIQAIEDFSITVQDITISKKTDVVKDLDLDRRYIELSINSVNQGVIYFNDNGKLVISTSLRMLLVDLIFRSDKNINVLTIEKLILDIVGMSLIK